MTTRTLRVALVGGPMYDPLYEAIGDFECQTGVTVDIVVQLPHPELNAWVERIFSSNGDPGIDLLSTHTKYAPSQAQWLSPLDDVIDEGHLGDLLPRPLELARIDGRLLQVPRNIDVRLLHYRRDLLGSSPPATWAQLADRASELTTSSTYGFVFPGRDSGLFGNFYELLVSAGGDLFDSRLRPAFESSAGVWAVSYLCDLYRVRRVAPEALPAWHYDEVSAAFRDGHAAMVCDWPGSYHLYRDPTACRVADRVGLARLPSGSAGISAAYGGCHSFAIPAAAKNRGDAARLLLHLTSYEAQLGEARRGSIPCRASALTQVRDEASAVPEEAQRWQLLAETEASMIVPPRFAAYPKCEDAIWRAVQHAMIGDVTPKQAVAQAARDISAIVDAA